MEVPSIYIWCLESSKMNWAICPITKFSTVLYNVHDNWRLYTWRCLVWFEFKYPMLDGAQRNWIRRYAAHLWSLSSYEGRKSIIFLKTRLQILCTFFPWKIVLLIAAFIFEHFSLSASMTVTDFSVFFLLVKFQIRNLCVTDKYRWSFTLDLEVQCGLFKFVDKCMFPSI